MRADDEREPLRLFVGYTWAMGHRHEYLIRVYEDGATIARRTDLIENAQWGPEEELEERDAR